jgi:hypothetical protein
LPETHQLIQVAQNLDNPTTRTREIRALSDAMRVLNLSRGLILSDANAQPIEENGLTIDIRSVAEWLISE